MHSLEHIIIIARLHLEVDALGKATVNDQLQAPVAAIDVCECSQPPADLRQRRPDLRAMTTTVMDSYLQQLHQPKDFDVRDDNYFYYSAIYYTLLVQDVVVLIRICLVGFVRTHQSA